MRRRIRVPGSTWIIFPRVQDADMYSFLFDQLGIKYVGSETSSAKGGK